MYLIKNSIVQKRSAPPVAIPLDPANLGPTVAALAASLNGTTAPDVEEVVTAALLAERGIIAPPIEASSTPPADPTPKRGRRARKASAALNGVPA